MARKCSSKKKYGTAYKRFFPRRMQIPKYLTALSNPFSPKAYGVRIPDASTVPSQSFYALDTCLVSTGTTGNGCASFCAIPNLAYLGGYGVPVGSSSWSWNSSFAAANIGPASILVQAQTNYSAIRPVASGIRISAVQNVTAAQGTMHVCYVPMTSFDVSTFWLPTSVSLMQKCEGYKRYPLSELTQKPVTLVNRPLDVTSQRYVDPSDSQLIIANQRGSFDFPCQWCALVVAFEGQSASTTSTIIVEVEFLTHYEGIVSGVGSNPVVPTSSNAETYVPTVIGAAAHQLGIQRIDEPMYEESEAEWDSVAVKALEAFEAANSGFLVGSRFGLLGGAAGAGIGAAWSLIGPKSYAAAKKKYSSRASSNYVRQKVARTSEYNKRRPLLKY